MSGKEIKNRKVLRRWRKVGRDEAEVVLSGRFFQINTGSATGKTRPPTVDSLTDGTSRWLLSAHSKGIIGRAESKGARGGSAPQLLAQPTQLRGIGVVDWGRV